MSLTNPRNTYKPFQYPWAHEAWKKSQQMHWMPEEVPMGDDVQDWKNRLTDSERNLVTQIFRYFTQADVEVNNNYHENYMKVFKPTEIRMMLSSFSNMETIHIAAYALLIETVGMPETEFGAFMKYKAMKDKSEFLEGFDASNPMETAVTLAAFGAFVEGMQLFASFAILLNFPRFGKMKGMGQIVTYSVRDETLHFNSIIQLYHQWVKEHTSIDRKELARRINIVCKEMVHHEDAFIDLAFEMGDIEGLKIGEIKDYIRYIADMRLRQLKLEPIYEIDENPLPWLEQQLTNVEFVNFFEQRATEYTRGATTGEWDDVFKKEFGA